MSDIKSVIRARDELARIVVLRENEIDKLLEKYDSLEAQLETHKSIIEEWSLRAESDDPYRLYFKVPEERIDLRHIKKVCIQTADGKDLWFEPNSSVEALMKKLAESLKRAEKAEAQLDKS